MWIIQVVNCREVMKALPKFLKYFISKVWGFSFRMCTQSETEYKAFKKNEVHHCKAIDIAIEESVSIVESLDSSNDKADDSSKPMASHDV